MPSLPQDEVLAVTTPAQFKAMAHPLRQRLLFALGQTPATISQLAGSLSVAKGSVAHHLKVLREAGMVRIGETRQVRGGTEQYYQRAARRFEVPDGLAGPTTALLHAVAEEVVGSPDPMLTVRHLRLTAEQAAEFRGRLQGLVDSLSDAGDGETGYGVLVTMYESG
ncbi:ArsR/SmtB family transcription factor [Crossiella cryophila]|uniref:DNA-binding transcriptional ArsR family regulator n=1 Tax=Crossiella cryophila TaxID=43355 RepID=A0A7W7FXH1_9PSEU|nr:winged helix-turn-helix domain-containing protein [Crossiella cryophila]MBB4678939.1 DNA-binding transcriptional ArsR family regulator [Crossiella cryophila]